MIHHNPPPPARDRDPLRLLRSRTEVAELLKIYARRTRPGDRDGVAAWYRLRPRLDARSRSPTRMRVWGVLTIAVGILVLVRLAPTSAGRDSAGPGSGFGGASGSVETGEMGVGGMEGAGGTEKERSTAARGAGGTAAATRQPACPARMG